MYGSGSQREDSSMAYITVPLMVQEQSFDSIFATWALLLGWSWPPEEDLFFYIPDKSSTELETEAIGLWGSVFIRQAKRGYYFPALAAMMMLVTK